MSEENKVTIDGEEYSFEGLTVETQANIARVNELRREVSALQIQVNDEGVIEDAKFKTYGCGSAIASSLQMIEMLKGKTLEEAKGIKDREIADLLELPPIKIHCSVLAEDSIKRAIADYESKKT